jgi:hypothetical protein
MNYKAREIVQNELDTGEKLLWAGMPRQGTVFRGSDVFMIPFSLLWGGFAIFWETMALAIPNEKAGAVGIVFPLFGIPFVLVGLYMIFGRFIYDSKKRAKTFYGLTDQRAIIVSGIFGKRVKSLNLRSLSDVSLSEKSDKSGTITFGQENLMLSFFGGNSFPGMGGSNVPKFELIENAKEVYNQLRAQQKS